MTLGKSAAFGLGIGFWLLSCLVALLQHAAFSVYHRDFAIYTNVIWNTAHERPFATTLLLLNRSHLAEHVAPILLPLSVLYQIVPDERVLIVIQQAALALAGIPIYLFARRRLGGVWAPLLVLASFYLCPLLSDIAYNKFHPVALATLPIGFGAYFMLSGRPGLGALIACTTLLVEETSTLSLLGLGLMLLCLRQARLGAIVCGVAAAWLLAATLIVMPGFHLEETLPEEGNRTLAKFSLLLQDPGEAWTLTRERAAEAAEWWLLPNAGLALLSPVTLIATLPTAGVLLFLNDPDDLRSHRAAPLLPLLWISSVQGLALLRAGWRGVGAGRGTGAVWRMRLALAALAALSLVAFALNSRLAGGGRFNPTTLTFSERSEALRRATRAVPDDARVGATLAAAAHLADRAYVKIFPLPTARALKPDRYEVDWWIFDMSQKDDVLRDLAPERANPLRWSPRYAVWFLDQRVMVATTQPPPAAHPAQETFGETLRLEGYDIQQSERGLVVQVHWRAIRRAESDLLRHLELLDANDRVLAGQEGWEIRDYFGTARWQADQVIVDEVSFPLDPAAREAVARIRLSWSDPGNGQRLPLTDGADSLELDAAPG